MLSLCYPLSLQLLEVLMNNIGEPIHKQVIDTGLLSALVKIVKKKVNKILHLIWLIVSIVIFNLV